MDFACEQSMCKVGALRVQRVQQRALVTTRRCQCLSICGHVDDRDPLTRDLIPHARHFQSKHRVTTCHLFIPGWDPNCHAVPSLRIRCDLVCLVWCGVSGSRSVIVSGCRQSARENISGLLGGTSNKDATSHKGHRYERSKDATSSSWPYWEQGHY